MFKIIVLDSFKCKEKSNLVKEHFESLNIDIPIELTYFIQWINIEGKASLKDAISDAENHINQESNYSILTRYLHENDLKFTLHSKDLVFVFMNDLSDKRSMEKLQQVIDYLEKDTHANIRNCFLITLCVLPTSRSSDCDPIDNSIVYANLSDYESLRLDTIQKWSNKAHYFHFLPFIVSERDHRGYVVDNSQVLQECSSFVASIAYSDENSLLNSLTKTQNIVENGYLTFGSNTYNFRYQDCKKVVSEDLSKVFLEEFCNGTVESIAFDKYVSKTSDYFSDFKYSYRDNNILEQSFNYTFTDLPQLNSEVYEPIKQIKKKYDEKDYFRKYPRIECYPCDLDDILKRINDWWLILRNGLLISVDNETRKFYNSDKHECNNGTYSKQLQKALLKYIYGGIDKGPGSFFKLRYNLKKLVDLYKGKDKTFISKGTLYTEIKSQINKLKLQIRKRPLLSWSLMKGFLLSIPFFYVVLFLNYSLFWKLFACVLIFIAFYVLPAFNYYLYRIRIENEIESIKKLFYDWYSREIYLIQSRVFFNLKSDMKRFFKTTLDKLDFIYHFLAKDLIKRSEPVDVEKYMNPIKFLSIIYAKDPEDTFKMCFNENQLKLIKDHLSSKTSIVSDYLSHSNCIFNSISIINLLKTLSVSEKTSLNTDLLNKFTDDFMKSLKAYTDESASKIMDSVAFTNLEYLDQDENQLKDTSELLTNKNTIKSCLLYFNDSKAIIETCLEKEINICSFTYSSIPRDYDLDICDPKLVFDQEDSSSLPMLSKQNNELLVTSSILKFFLFHTKILVGIPIVLLGNFIQYAQAYYSLNDASRLELRAIKDSGDIFEPSIIKKMFDINI